MGRDEEKVDLPDLQALLKECFDDQLKLVDYRVTKLLPYGENFCSTMLKIDATVLNDLKEEKLHLVAKTGNDFEKYPLMWSKVFKKEVFFYRELIPMYRQLQLEMGVNEDDLFINVAKFYGYRDSLNKDQEEVDRDSLMLLENLKVHGYYTVNRRIGMDYNHAKKALTTLAKYHAIGIAIKQKNPEFFETVKSHARVIGVYVEKLHQIFNNAWEALQNIPCLAKYLDTIQTSFDFCKGGKVYTIEPEDPWATITHGDFWCNNMLFHKNKNTGEVDDIKFCDFQIYLYQSPLRDLAYFLTTSINENVETEHFDNLLENYYKTFVKTIEIMQCEGNFTRKSFDVELKKQAIMLFANNILVIRVCTSNVEEKKNNENNFKAVFENKEEDIYINKLLRFIRVYEKKNWFSNIK